MYGSCFSCWGFRLVHRNGTSSTVTNPSIWLWGQRLCGMTHEATIHQMMWLCLFLFFTSHFHHCHSRVKYWCWGNHHLSLLGKSGKSKFLLLKCQFLLDFTMFYYPEPLLPSTTARWRSNDVPVLCTEPDGGGHAAASGARVPGGTAWARAEGRDRSKRKSSHVVNFVYLCIILYHEANLFGEKHKLYNHISQVWWTNRPWLISWSGASGYIRWFVDGKLATAKRKALIELTTFGVYPKPVTAVVRMDQWTNFVGKVYRKPGILAPNMDAFCNQNHFSQWNRKCEHDWTHPRQRLYRAKLSDFQ